MAHGFVITAGPSANVSSRGRRQNKAIVTKEKMKKKKARTTFTGRQIFELEKHFGDKKYLTATQRSEMASLLNVTETQVKIWFQNRRTKWKRQEKDLEEKYDTTTTDTPNKQFVISSGESINPPDLNLNSATLDNQTCDTK